MATRREAEGIGASRKRRRQTAKKPSAALYIGYSEDSESIGALFATIPRQRVAYSLTCAGRTSLTCGGRLWPESIMAKFAAVENAQEAKKENVRPGNTACEEPALTEAELQRALQVDDSDVPLPFEQKVAPPRKGSLVERLGAAGEYEPLDEYVPCEVDADEAQRVMQKLQYPTDDVPERRLSKALGRDLFEADLYGIDAYTFSQVRTISLYNTPMHVRCAHSPLHPRVCVCVQVVAAVSASEGSPGLSAADAVHFTESLVMPLLHLRAVGLTAAKNPVKASLLPSHVDVPAGRNKARAGSAPSLY